MLFGLVTVAITVSRSKFTVHFHTPMKILLPIKYDEQTSVRYLHVRGTASSNFKLFLQRKEWYNLIYKCTNISAACVRRFVLFKHRWIRTFEEKHCVKPPTNIDCESIDGNLCKPMVHSNLVQVDRCGNWESALRLIAFGVTIVFVGCPADLEWELDQIESARKELLQKRNFNETLKSVPSSDESYFACLRYLHHHRRIVFDVELWQWLGHVAWLPSSCSVDQCRYS